MGDIRLDLLVLHTPDIEKLKTFYQSLLNLEFKKSQHGGPAHYECIIGEVVLEIYPTKKQIDQSASIGFMVPNLDDAIKRVGIEYVHQKPLNTEHGRRAMLYDPDKRSVHLVEKQ